MPEEEPEKTPEEAPEGEDKKGEVAVEDLNIKEVLLKWEVGFAILIMIAMAAFFQQKFWILFLLTCTIVLSRAAPTYDKLKMEIHSLIVLGVGSVFGAWPAIFISLASAPFINKVGKMFGTSHNNLWVLLDTIYLVALSLIASFLPESGLKIYGLLSVIIIGNLLTGSIKVFTFNRSPVRRVMESGMNILFNYVFLWNLLPAFLAFLK